jgi:hypothetical protein
MATGGDGDLELRANTVRCGDQDRVLVSRCLEIKKRAEAAEAGFRAGARRRFGERLDRLYQGIASINVDAGIAVILALYGALDRYTLLPRKTARRRDNTFDPERFAMLLKRWTAGCVAVLLLSVISSHAALAENPNDVFTVAGVRVDATAANATAARDQALADGEQRAFSQLLERLTLAADRNRVPRVRAAQLNDLVQGFDVANERRSGVRYLAEYTFHFSPDAVRQLLRQAGIPFTETPSKPLIVLAVLHDGDRDVLWDDPNPWRDAWVNTKIPAGFVPLLQPNGDLDDVAAIDAEAASHGDDARLQTISQLYDGNSVLVAEATVTRAPARRIAAVAKRYWPGNPGNEPSWIASVAATEGESDAAMMGRAVVALATQIQDAWKAGNAIDTRRGGTILAVVPAATLPAWIGVRDRLAGIPAVLSTQLMSLDRAGARVEIHYAGDAAQLKTVLAQHELDLSGSDPTWVLQQHGRAAPPH